NQKAWYVIGAIGTAAGPLLMSMLPETRAGLATLSVVVFTTSTCSSLLGMAVESLMAHCTPEDQKGRAAGWFQAGNLGGTGIGGGLGLLLAQHLPGPWMSGAIVAGLCLACGLALPGLPTPAREAHARFTASLAAVGRDLWTVTRRRAGALA